MWLSGAVAGLRAKIAFPGTASTAAKARFDELIVDEGMDTKRSELRIRVALFDAQQTGSFEDVAHAVLMAQQQRTEGLKAVAENAFEGEPIFAIFRNMLPKWPKTPAPQTTSRDAPKT